MIILIDFGSQSTHLISRRIRELGESVLIVEPEEALEKIQENNPKGIILSGGPASVYGDKAPTVEKEIFDLNIPILGICYGQQLIGHLLEGDGENGIRAALNAGMETVVVGNTITQEKLNSIDPALPHIKDFTELTLE